MVQVRWLKEAKNDLRNIYEYIAKDSEKYAALQVRRVKERTHILKNHVHIGKIVEEINKPDVREIVEGNYRIIYRTVNAEKIDVLMIHHGARDLTRRIE